MIGDPMIALHLGYAVGVLFRLEDELELQLHPVPQSWKDDIKRAREGLLSAARNLDIYPPPPPELPPVPAPVIHALRYIGMPEEVRTPEQMGEWIKGLPLPERDSRDHT